MTITLGPIGILALLSVLAFGALVSSSSRQSGYLAGLGEALLLLGLMLFWLGIGVAKLFVWLGWL